MTMKNLWSLTVDEALTAEKLKKSLGRNFEVFFPTNSQLKDIDLIVYDLKKCKPTSLQIKGSRTYDYQDEPYSWNMVKKESIFNPKNVVDFFIFVIHLTKLSQKKRIIEQAYIIVPINDLKKLSSKKKIRGSNLYAFVFWIDKNRKLAIDYASGQQEIDFSKYLNNFELLKKMKKTKTTERVMV